MANDIPPPPGPLGPVTPEPDLPAPMAAPGAARIDDLLGGLASDEFAEREQAHAELTKLARRVPGVADELVRRVDGLSDVEARWRVSRILRELSKAEGALYDAQAERLEGNLMAIRHRFPNGSELETEARADLRAAELDADAAREDVPRSNVDERRRRAEARERRFEERRKELNPVADFFGDH